MSQWTKSKTISNMILITKNLSYFFSKRTNGTGKNFIFIKI